MTRHQNITTFDLLKTFAIIFMIIDHVGFYFITPPMGGDIGDPALWLRVLGRFCVPIWFFLMGYTRSRTVPLPWIVGAGVLIAANLITGMFILPLNALVSMMVIRLIIDPVARVMFRDREGMVAILVLLVLLYFPTNDMIEYGSGGLLIALVGYAVRARRDGTAVGILQSSGSYRAFLTGAISAVVMSQYMSFRFDGDQAAVMGMGMIAVFGVLFFVRPRDYPQLTAGMPPWVGAGVRFCGRQTMEIYVIHLTAFKFAALVFGIGYPIYGWFDWDYTIYGAFRNAH